jgi:hypothetical protein
MRCTRVLILAAVAAALAVIVGVTSAQAVEQVPFTITEHINFTTGEATFTATGPLCPSGTFEDSVAAVGVSHTGASGMLNLLITTVYTCDDNSGTFTMLKHVFITFNEDGFTNTGPVQILGGTGAYADLVGHGVDNGSTSGDIGVGNIAGWVIPVGGA